MYAWRKSAEQRWINARQDILQLRARGGLVIVQRPRHTRLQLEIVCSSRDQTQALVAEFGGRIEKLPKDWLERFSRDDSAPINIGRRLIITPSISILGCSSLRRSYRTGFYRANTNPLATAKTTARIKKPAVLLIPAATAFGTGEHVTTAMSLRFLEELTRQWKRKWSMVDLGTGSGILALAAKRFGASRVLGIDKDPTAVSIAKSNARLNKIYGATFRLADVRRWKSARNTNVVTANLYSDLLMKILPQLKGSGWLILSGILRSHENEFLRALRRNDIQIVRAKRRGKWIAVLGKSRACSGFGEQLTHRTGHSIGEETHGNSSNIDDFETRDLRRITPGVCFSIASLLARHDE